METEVRIGITRGWGRKEWGVTVEWVQSFGWEDEKFWRWWWLHDTEFTSCHWTAHSKIIKRVNFVMNGLHNKKWFQSNLSHPCWCISFPFSSYGWLAVRNWQSSETWALGLIHREATTKAPGHKDMSQKTILGKRSVSCHYGPLCKILLPFLLICFWSDLISFRYVGYISLETFSNW